MTVAVKAKGTPAPGEAPYALLKFEGGVHRVQRVPVTESQGRVHTSAAGVLVLPEAEPVDVQVNDNDLRIDVFRSSGPGGQSVNTTDSAVRITHLPTGIVVSCQNEKSQLQNREQAMRILRARLLAAAQEEANAEASDARRLQVRTVDRSERIRTYNFPENRISDHRTGYKSYDLDRVLDGDLDAVIASCVEADMATLDARVDAGSELGPMSSGVRPLLRAAEQRSPRPASPVRSTTRQSCSPTSWVRRGASCPWSRRSRPTGSGTFEALVARRASREPLQHLTGIAAFRHVELAVGPGVFVPRPETELLAGWAIERAPRAREPGGRRPVHRLRRDRRERPRRGARRRGARRRARRSAPTPGPSATWPRPASTCAWATWPRPSPTSTAPSTW